MMGDRSKTSCAHEMDSNSYSSLNSNHGSNSASTNGMSNGTTADIDSNMKSNSYSNGYSNSVSNSSNSSNGKEKLAEVDIEQNSSALIETVDSVIPIEKTSSIPIISGGKEAIWLAIWMANNVMVTILNKAAFAKVDFKYPYALSAIHMMVNLIGAQCYFMVSKTAKPKHLQLDQSWQIAIFSVVFSLNIAIGNVSLRYVSVNFNQVARSLVPVIVLFISIVFYGKHFSSTRKCAVIPIVAGVALAFYGDMSFTSVGVFYTVMCVLLAALKVIVGGELLSGNLRLHPMDLLLKMCPLAVLQISVMSILTGEVNEILERQEQLLLSSAPQVILLSALLSFSLNVSSFVANKATSPLTLCIAANFKQVLLVAFGTLYFGDYVSTMNGIGIVTVILGSFRYGMVAIYEKKTSK